MTRWPQPTGSPFRDEAVGNGVRTPRTGFKARLRRSVKRSLYGYDKGSSPHLKLQYLARLGQGAYGSVHRARRLDTGELIAVKKVKLRKGAEKEAVWEAKILRKLDHPSIVQLHSAFVVDRKLHLCMELAEVGSLSDVLQASKSFGGLVEPEIMAISRSILAALTYLHSHNIIHRDIKSGNVLMTGAGTIKVGDLGACLEHKDPGDSDPLISRDLVGTPYWMAPEIISFDKKNQLQKYTSAYTSKVDVWSFGITLLEMTNGKPPHYDCEVSEALQRIITTATPQVSLRRRWSLALHSLARDALVMRPAFRASARQLLDNDGLSQENVGPEVLSRLVQQVLQVNGTFVAAKRAVAPKGPDPQYLRTPSPPPSPATPRRKRHNPMPRGELVAEATPGKRWFDAAGILHRMDGQSPPKNFMLQAQGNMSSSGAQSSRDGVSRRKRELFSPTQAGKTKLRLNLFKYPALSPVLDELKV